VVRDNIATKQLLQNYDITILQHHFTKVINFVHLVVVKHDAMLFSWKCMDNYISF